MAGPAVSRARTEPMCASPDRAASSPLASERPRRAGRRARDRAGWFPGWRNTAAGVPAGQRLHAGAVVGGDDVPPLARGEAAQHPAVQRHARRLVVDDAMGGLSTTLKKMSGPAAAGDALSRARIGSTRSRKPTRVVISYAQSDIGLSHELRFDSRILPCSSTRFNVALKDGRSSQMPHRRVSRDAFASFVR